MSLTVGNYRVHSFMPQPFPALHTAWHEALQSLSLLLTAEVVRATFTVACTVALATA